MNYKEDEKIKFLRKIGYSVDLIDVDVDEKEHHNRILTSTTQHFYVKNPKGQELNARWTFRGRTAMLDEAFQDEFRKAIFVTVMFSTPPYDVVENDDKTIWVASASEEDFDAEEYATRDEAIEGGIEEAKEAGTEAFYIGTKAKPKLHPVGVGLADKYLETIVENFHSNHDAVIDSLRFDTDLILPASSSQIRELDDLLAEAFESWVEKTKLDANHFFVVENRVEMPVQRAPAQGPDKDKI